MRLYINERKRRDLNVKIQSNFGKKGKRIFYLFQ